MLKVGGIAALGQRIDIIATRLSVVSISLRDPAVAPKIFERLNYGAEPITVADLVRNEVFARSSDDPATAHHLFSTRWEPFVDRFRDKNSDLDRFLFPYGLISNPNIRKVELFTALRRMWDRLPDPGAIIVEEATVCAALDAVESFLFRRAVVGIEPPGLHAVFKGLWQDLLTGFEGRLDEALSVGRLQAAIRSKPTITWPGAEEFQAAIAVGELYRRKIASYALREFEVSLKGESPSDVHQVEHIAPQAPTPVWATAIPADYAELVHTWGNLLPLTASMNPSTGQSPFETKRKAYADSIFASAREVAKAEAWDAEAIRARSGRIAAWALTRWSY